MTPRPALRAAPTKRVATIAAALALAGAASASCSSFARSAGPKALAILPGVVNRDDNKSLRFAMLKYGLDSFCQEMTHRGAPLKLADDQPAIGRFFPERCESQILDEETGPKSFLVQFSGRGFAYMTGAARVGFEASGVVDYAPDFLLDGGTLYLYFRTRHIGATSFKTAMIEGAHTSALGQLAGAVVDVNAIASQLGSQIVARELTRGFTVIRADDGSVESGLGIVDKGKHPPRPFEIHGDGRATLANERVDVHREQRDVLGPFEVDDAGRALFLTATVEGADAVDLLVLPKDAADPWLATYVAQPGTTPPPFAPVFADVATRGAPWKRTIPLPKGHYYLFVDNTSTAGRVAPAAATFDDRVATVGCAVQLGDAP